jgi:Eukaryotic translation initiation factor 4G1
MSGGAQIYADSSAFVPRPRSRTIVNNAEGLDVDLSAIAKSSPFPVARASLASSFGLGTAAFALPSRRPSSVRTETEEQRRKRLADEEKKEKANVKAQEEAEEREREQKQKRKEERKARKQQETHPITTSPLPDSNNQPSPSDPSDIKSASPSLPSALTTARVIEDLDSVLYPEGISSPKVELNVNAKNGKFR